MVGEARTYKTESRMIRIELESKTEFKTERLTLAEEETKAGESRKTEGLKQVEGEVEIEEGAKDLNFGGISRSSKDAGDALEVCCDQLTEPFMFCLVLLLSIVRREEAAIHKIIYERLVSDIYRKWLVRKAWEKGKRRRGKRDVMYMFVCV